MNHKNSIRCDEKSTVQRRINRCRDVGRHIIGDWNHVRLHLTRRQPREVSEAKRSWGRFHYAQNRQNSGAPCMTQPGG